MTESRRDRLDLAFLIMFSNTHTHTHTRIGITEYCNDHAYMYTCVHFCVMCVCVQCTVYIYEWSMQYSAIYIYIYIYVCVCVCVCVCMCVRVIITVPVYYNFLTLYPYFSKTFVPAIQQKLHNTFVIVLACQRKTFN